jgi:hypothetical protein
MGETVWDSSMTADVPLQAAAAAAAFLGPTFLFGQGPHSAHPDVFYCKSAEPNPLWCVCRSQSSQMYHSVLLYCLPVLQVYSMGSCCVCKELACPGLA